VSATFERLPATTGAAGHGRGAPVVSARGSAAVRLLARVRRSRVSLLWLAPLLVVTALTRLVNLAGTPQRFDDEGTYVAQAYAVLHWGQLSHYTYWYDHPPLGWAQIAAYLGLTDALARHSSAVAAGREAMVVAAVVSAVLLWTLTRRIGCTRPAAALAVGLMAVSPLAIQFQKTVYLDNVATPWLLATFVLLSSRRRSLSAYLGAGVCFGVAVLSKETYLLALPGVVWVAWRSVPRSTRRYALPLAGALSAFVLSAYALLAVLKGELLPGAGHVSLVDGIAFQLVRRVPSGGVLDPSSLAHAAVAQWLGLDTVLPAASVLTAAAGLFSARLRPYAAMYGFFLLVALRPGYLPVPYVIMLLPFAALLTAGVFDLLLSRARRPRGPGAAVLAWRVRSVAAPAVAAAAAVAALTVGVPSASTQYRGIFESHPDLAAAQAQTWLAANVHHGQKVITDDSLWLDLVRGGQPRADVVWYYKVDTDPAVAGNAPDGWRDYTWIVSTQSVRQFPASFPIVAAALDHSYVAATFGTGDLRVEVRRIDPASAASKAAVAAQVRSQPGSTVQTRRVVSKVSTAVDGALFTRAGAARAAAGAQLMANPNIITTPAVRDLFTSGQVDLRVETLLALLATTGPVHLQATPAKPGEYPPVTPRRELVLTGSPTQLRAAKTFFTAQQGGYRASLSTRHNGDLAATLPLLDPAQQAVAVN